MAGSLDFGRRYCIPKGQSCRDCFADLSLGAITLVSPGDKEAGPGAVRPSCSSDAWRRLLCATSAVFRTGDRPIGMHTTAKGSKPHVMPAAPAPWSTRTGCPSLGGRICDASRAAKSLRPRGRHDDSYRPVRKGLCGSQSVGEPRPRRSLGVDFPSRRHQIHTSPYPLISHGP
jgi:hypothetical protein